MNEDNNRGSEWPIVLGDQWETLAETDIKALKEAFARAVQGPERYIRFKSTEPSGPNVIKALWDREREQSEAEAMFDLGGAIDASVVIDAAKSRTEPQELTLRQGPPAGPGPGDLEHAARLSRSLHTERDYIEGELTLIQDALGAAAYEAETLLDEGDPVATDFAVDTLRHLEEASAKLKSLREGLSASQPKRSSYAPSATSKPPEGAP